MQKRINPYKLFHGSFIPEWLEERPIKEISLGAKLIYARLTRYAGKDGACFPKLQEISDATGISFSQVQRYIKELKKIGLIESVQLGKKCSNRYFFLEHPWMMKAIYVESDRSDMTNPEKSDRSDSTSPMVWSDSTSPQKENQERESLSQEFEKFIKAYPRRVNIPAAEKAFKRLKCHKFIDQILSDIEYRKKNDKTWKDPQFIPYPASYLKAERWTEEKSKTVSMSLYDLYGLK